MITSRFSPIGKPLARGLLLAVAVLICTSGTFAQDGSASGPVNADRVVLRFEGSNFEVVSVTPVVKVIPPSVPLPAGETLVSGTWFELRSSQDDVRYRTMIGDPFRLVFEGPDPEKQLSAGPDRKEAVLQEGIFSLVVPRALPGDQIVVFSSPTHRAAVGQPAQEITRISLTPEL